MGGRDGGTLPPGIKSEDHLEIFIDLMCRKINLEFEKSVEHKSLPSLRFIPPSNAMGSHQDMDPSTGGTTRPGVQQFQAQGQAFYP